MPQTDLFLLFTEPLEAAGIDYMVSGSVAAIVYGEPRLTNDVDIILHLRPADVSKLTDAFPLVDFYCPPHEVMMLELRRLRRGHFNLIHHNTGHKADIYLAGADPLHVWGFARRRRIDVTEVKALWVAPPEYVIARKLEYYAEGGSEKHRFDIQGILAVSGDQLDREALRGWIQRCNVMDPWVSIAGEVGFA